MRKTVLAIVACLGLTACSSSAVGPVETANFPNNASVSAYLKNHPNALDALKSSGIKLLRVGDYVRFIVPSAFLFKGLGSRIQAAAYPAMDQVVDMVKAVPKESMTVKAYMFTNSSNAVARKLTSLQALAVSNYLMRHGVNTRLLYTFGMGNHNQVTHAPDRLLQNYRVEITLKALKTRLSA